MTTTTAGLDVVTVRDALTGALRAAKEYNTADLVEPVAILWPDADRAWSSVVPLLATELPIITLGPYDSSRSQGPPPWLRMQVMQGDSETSPQLPTIVYLPGVARRTLSDFAGLDSNLQSLAGLVVRSAFFNQKNGTDWTPTAFLTNEAIGIRLDIAGTQEGRQALVRSLPRLLDVRVSELRGRTLDTADFDALLVDDPSRQLLLWLSDPFGYQANLESENTWEGFASLVKKQYKVDLVADGELAGGLRLGERQGKWLEVWNRFAEAPQAFPGVVDVLRRSKPDDVIPLFPDSWPQDNDEAERSTLSAVSSLTDKPTDQIRAAIESLHREHVGRLSGVWSRLGQCPAALLVDRLAALAAITVAVGDADSIEKRALWYATTGWQADEAFLSTLSALELAHPQSSAVQHVAEALYRPWLEALVQGFQAAWIADPPQSQASGVTTDEPEGTCALFVDGLRMDLGAQLEQLLSARGLDAQRNWGFSGVPTVTATCKPAVLPIADQLATGHDLTPTLPSGSAATQEPLKKVLADQGWSYVAADEVGDPTGRAWTEGGNVDTLGHSLGVKLAHQVPNQVTMLATRITELLNAGWKKVVVITDHGWLLVPGGLPKHHLPEHLAVIRKARCARLTTAGTAPAGINTLPWRWDRDVDIALAPGIHAFEAGTVYEHGGLSPQESVVPQLTVTRPAQAAEQSPTLDIMWVGLTLKIDIEYAPDGCFVDLRTKAADPSTSVVAAAKPIKDGKARLMATDEYHGQAVIVVLVGPNSEPLANKPTQIPEG